MPGDVEIKQTVANLKDELPKIDLRVSSAEFEISKMLIDIQNLKLKMGAIAKQVVEKTPKKKAD